VAERALVIVPTYNERDNISTLIGRILEQDPRLEVLVVDDGSPDGTGDIVDEIATREPRVHAMHRGRKLGLGTAYCAGFKWAFRTTRRISQCFSPRSRTRTSCWAPGTTRGR
jgi:dolichol-phosphate mannosyltransferase